MPQPIVYVDVSRIREGKLEGLESAMKHLAAFVESEAPCLISYGFFLDAERRQMTVVAIHPDSESLEFHLNVGGAEFQKFRDLIDLSSINVYGAISPVALERLRQKARMLGGAAVSVHELYSGFAR